jgi:hypothetical protein
MVTYGVFKIVAGVAPVLCWRLANRQRALQVAREMRASGTYFVRPCR